MIKKTLYPKTKRVSTKQKQVEITEKLDGSNLGLFRKGDKLIVAQRNNVFCFNSIEENGSQGLYKGLYGWLKENADEILASLYDNSGIYGEWLGMGKIAYGGSDIDKKFYAFAKARLLGETFEEYQLENIVYSQELIPWAFNERNIPNCVGLAPLVQLNVNSPTKEELDILYGEYCNKLNRKVEGFVVNNNETISKYVRYKDAKFTEHKE